MDKEMEKFQQDMLKSVRQMKAGKAARTTQVALSPAGAYNPNRHQDRREIMLNVKLDAELSKGIARLAKREKTSRTAVVRTAVALYLEEEADAADVAKRKNESVISLQQLGKRLGLES